MIEFPPGSGPGTVNDAFFRFVVDMGGPGPDQGKGGKYLIVPPDTRANSQKERLLRCAFPIVRELADPSRLPRRRQAGRGVEVFRDGLKVYPLSKAGTPPEMEFFDGSKVPYNTIHANDSSSTRSSIT